MVRETGQELLEREIECFTNSQERGQSYRAPGLDPLPMTDTEAIGVHVLLAQIAIRSERPNPVAQLAEEPLVVGG